MTEEIVTYATVADAFLSKLINMCDNVARYGNIDNNIPAGQRPFIDYNVIRNTPHSYYEPTDGQAPTYIPQYRVQLVRNGIPRGDSSTLTNSFNQFINSLGLTMSDKCAMNGLFYLLENFTAFILANVRYATSVYSANKWVVYIPASATKITHDLSELGDNYVRLNMLNEIMLNYMNNIKNKLRAYPAIYQYTCLN